RGTRPGRTQLGQGGDDGDPWVDDAPRPWRGRAGRGRRGGLGLGCAPGSVGAAYPSPGTGGRRGAAGRSRVPRAWVAPRPACRTWWSPGATSSPAAATAPSTRATQTGCSPAIRSGTPGGGWVEQIWGLLWTGSRV